MYNKFISFKTIIRYLNEFSELQTCRWQQDSPESCSPYTFSKELQSRFIQRSRIKTIQLSQPTAKYPHFSRAFAHFSKVARARAKTQSLNTRARRVIIILRFFDTTHWLFRANFHLLTPRADVFKGFARE